MSESSFVMLDNTSTDGETAAAPAALRIPEIDMVVAAAEEISDAAPEVQPHVIEEHLRQQAGAPVDSDGTPFDSNIHSTNADGEGIKTARGLWRKKRGSGKGGGPSSTVGVQAAGAITPDAAQQAARMTGQALAQMTFIVGRVVGGEEWAPRVLSNEKGDTVLDENAMLTDAYTQYAISKNLRDIPPGVALSFALIAYAGPRFTMPITRSRLSKAKEWIAQKIVRWKMRRAARRAGIPEHT